MMLKQFISLIALFSFAVIAAQEQVKITNEASAKIDTYLSEVVGKYNIPGISVAVIKNDKTIHRNDYGKANIEYNIPVSDKSIFRIYSLTKTIIVTGAFQLIEQNKLSLEDPISKYLHDLPDSWNSVQVKHLVTHSSGLPDIVNYEQFPENEAKRKSLQMSYNLRKVKNLNTIKLIFGCFRKLLKV